MKRFGVLALVLFVVGCSESEPEPFMEYSVINEQLLCEYEDSEEFGYHYTYTFKTKYLEELTDEVVEVNYYEQDESGEFVLYEAMGDFPFRELENLVEFSYKYTDQYADDENMEIVETNYSVLVVINMENLKGKDTVSYELFGRESSYVNEIQCEKL